MVPLLFGTAEHPPVCGLHVPVLHAFDDGLQSTGVPPLQFRVAWSHVSAPLHGFLSSQSMFTVHGHALLSKTHPPADSLQVSTVHAIPSLHATGAPPHAPALHTSV